MADWNQIIKDYEDKIVALEQELAEKQFTYTGKQLAFTAACFVAFGFLIGLAI